MDFDVTLSACLMLAFLCQAQAQGVKQSGCGADYRGNAPKARAKVIQWLPGRVWMDLDNALKEGWLSRIVLYIQGAAPNINADGRLVVWRLTGTENGTWSRVARVIWFKRVRFKHETSRKYEVCLNRSEAPRVTGADRLGWMAINWPFTLAADFDRGGTIPYADVPQDVVIPNMSARFIRVIKQARVSLGGFIVNDYRGNAPKARARVIQWLPGRVWMDLDNALKEGWLSRIVLYIQGAAPNINADGRLVVWRLTGTENGTWSRVARVIWFKRVRFKHETSRKYEVCLNRSEAPRVTGADRLGWMAINWPFTLAADFDRGGTIPYADVPQDVVIPNMSARFIRVIKQARVSLGGFIVNDKSCLGSNAPYSAEPDNCESTYSTTSTTSSTTSSTTFSTTSPPTLFLTHRTSGGGLMTSYTGASSDPDGSGEQPLVTKLPNRKRKTRDPWSPWSVTWVTTDVTTTRTTVVSDTRIAIYAGAASGGLAVLVIVMATVLLVRRKRMMTSKENANLHPKASLRSVHQYEDLGHDTITENGYDSLTTFIKAAGPFSNVTYTDPDVTAGSGVNDARSMTSSPSTSAPLRPSVRSQHVYEDLGAVPQYVEPTTPRNEYLDILPPEGNEIPSSGAPLGGAASQESAPGGAITSNVPVPTYLELIPPDPNERSSR